MFLISSVRSPSLGLQVLCNTERLKTYLISGEIVYNLLNMSNTAIEITIQLNNHDSSNKKNNAFRRSQYAFATLFDAVHCVILLYVV